MLKKTLLYTSLFISSLCLGQLAPNIGQFHYNQMLFNPAFAGNSSALRANVLHRAQFLGADGAPNTQMVSVDAPLANKIGVGGTIMRHKVGLVNQVELGLNTSYRLKFNKHSFLQFGMKAGYGQFSFQLNDGKIWDENDPYLDAYGNGGLVRIGSGAVFQHKDFYAGIAAPDLVSVDIKGVFDSEEGSTLERNYIFNSGIDVVINEFTTLSPHLMIKYYNGRALNYYLNLGVELNQTLLIGFSLVHPMAYGAYARVNISPKIKAGFHYEFDNNNTELGNFSTTEFTLSYGFN